MTKCPLCNSPVDLDKFKALLIELIELKGRADVELSIDYSRYSQGERAVIQRVNDSWMIEDIIAPSLTELFDELEVKYNMVVVGLWK